MTNPWRHIQVEARGTLCCVRLRHTRLTEVQIDELANEIVAAGQADGCTRIALSLGPKPPECLYSVFLGKLISVQRRLREAGRELMLCEAGPEVRSVFGACKLTEHFTFVADFDAAARA
jgi:hypothetical protein